MSAEERERALEGRRIRKFPDHSPPHFKLEVPRLVHLTAACYEHKPILGRSPARMAEFEEALTTALSAEGCLSVAWCVLPTIGTCWCGPATSGMPLDPSDACTADSPLRGTGKKDSRAGSVGIDVRTGSCAAKRTYMPR